MIHLDQVHIQAGQFRLQNVSLEVDTGQYIALMGRTGCGKTTLLEAISGLRRLDQGRIKIGGVDVTEALPGDRQVGYVPQDMALFPTMTVRQHLEFALKIRKAERQYMEHRVTHLANSLSIGHLLERRPLGLSGGESQRVALGRALSFEPKVLLLDEPLSALDDQTRDGLIELLLQIKESRTVTVLHVTHNRAEATALADRVVQLGECALSTPPE